MKYYCYKFFILLSNGKVVSFVQGQMYQNVEIFFVRIISVTPPHPIFLITTLKHMFIFKYFRNTCQVLPSYLQLCIIYQLYLLLILLLLFILILLNNNLISTTFFICMYVCMYVCIILHIISLFLYVVLTT